jgi:hypothetical protein
MAAPSASAPAPSSAPAPAVSASAPSSASASASASAAAAAAASATSRSEEATRVLAELQAAVQAHSRTMRRAIDANDLTGALKHAAHLVGELRTAQLGPKLYYELYLDAFDCLAPLETFFQHLVRGGTPARDLYEAVQHAGSVLQRLYLLVLAAGALIRSRQAPARDVLADVMEHAKGVQHPQRGLFLRYFLLQKLRDRLPDRGSGYELSGDAAAAAAATAAATAAAGRDAKDCIDLLAGNLVEMNRLWVRMQAPASGGGPLARNRKRRERERQELRILVGSNLTRLAGLAWLDLAQYRAAVLPRVLAELIGCRDRIAQAYLAEGLLQVFPVEFHLRTLDELLRMLPQLVSDHATIKSVALALLARIQEGALMGALHNGEAGATAGAGASVAPLRSVLGLPQPPVVLGALPSDVDVFGTILQYLAQLASDPLGPFKPLGGAAGDAADDAGAGAPGGGGDVASGSPGSAARPKSSARLASMREAGDVAASAQPLASLLEVFAALLRFSLALYPGHRAYVDATLGATAKALRDVMGLAAPADPSSVAQASLAAAMGSASASLGAVASEALRHLLLPPGEAAGAVPRAAVAAAAEAATAGAAAASAASASAASAGTAPLVSSPFVGPAAIPLDEACSRLVVSLLATAQAALGLDVLQLLHYSALMQPLAFRHRRDAAAQLLVAVLAAPAAGVAARLADVAVVRQLLSALLPLIRDDGATPADALPEAEEKARFEAEQANLARLVKLLGSIGGEGGGGGAGASGEKDALRARFEALRAARDFFSWGGAQRVNRTYPALVHEAVAVAASAKRLHAAAPAADAVTPKAAFEFVHELCSTLAVAEHGELSLGLFLAAARAADDAHFSHEFLAQAFLLYEDVADSRRQAPCLASVVAALAAARGLRAEDYEGLARRATLLGSRLLRRPDQARALLAAAPLFWRGAGALGDGAPAFERPLEVLACLQRALRAADAGLPPQPHVFLDVLAGYTALHEARVPTVSAANLADLLALCAEHVAAAERAERDAAAAKAAAAAANGGRAQAQAQAHAQADAAASAAEARQRLGELTERVGRT